MTHMEATGGYVKEIVRVSGWDMAIFEPNLFPYKYSNIFKTIHPSYLPTYEDGTDRMFRNVGI
jgi:folate-dependent phosphoribosylglycinamide formyltransferase PurN